MYVYGGKTSVLNNSNKLYSYEFETNTWNEEKTTKEILPFFIDSHNAILYEQNEKAEMIVFGGFLGNYSKYSNNVFAFDLKKQEWKFYFENLPGKQKEKVINIQKQKPKKRSNSSINIIENFLFVFGGCKGSLKLNDLWKFDLINCSWRQIIYQNETAPEVFINLFGQNYFIFLYVSKF